MRSFIFIAESSYYKGKRNDIKSYDKTCYSAYWMDK